MCRRCGGIPTATTSSLDLPTAACASGTCPGARACACCAGTRGPSPAQPSLQTGGTQRLALRTSPCAFGIWAQASRLRAMQHTREPSGRWPLATTRAVEAVCWLPGVLTPRCASGTSTHPRVQPRLPWRVMWLPVAAWEPLTASLLGACVRCSPRVRLSSRPPSRGATCFWLQDHTLGDEPCSGRLSSSVLAPSSLQVSPGRCCHEGSLILAVHRLRRAAPRPACGGK
mmetsp:Transcript_21641/g.67524  ORF Transcript_21641/g.67524 Transcript_21641/m.67524 type:complete len:228 (-) Transcript_21641:167-850(-)